MQLSTIGFPAPAATAAEQASLAGPTNVQPPPIAEELMVAAAARSSSGLHCMRPVCCLNSPTGEFAALLPSSLKPACCLRSKTSSCVVDSGSTQSNLKWYGSTRLFKSTDTLRSPYSRVQV